MDIEDNFSMINKELKENKELTKEEKELAKQTTKEDILFERMVSSIVNNINEKNEELP